ncbi:MAG TPA: RNA 2',3'-cyclic phosphodiesterase [Verrucomicrobiae bacterium]|nr:RNA 2',3'-cyclic phosphodiesterase [Verrucomicrobiae bacterium]
MEAMHSENRAATLRLFVAIAIPDSVRNEMIRVQQELKPLALGDVRWVNPEQLHLTLKFLGNVPAGSITEVKHSLAEACAGVRPFHLRANGVGFFPNARSPRVVWAGIEDDENVLAGLQVQVERLLAPFTEKPGAESFHAHATLGRFQKYRRHKTEGLLQRALKLGGHVFGGWRVEEAGLFQSELSSNGARHTRVAVFPFDAKLPA